MEELADAIEDAQYVNEIACVKVGPKPTRRWFTPTEEQLECWKRSKLPSRKRAKELAAEKAEKAAAASKAAASGKETSSEKKETKDTTQDSTGSEESTQSSSTATGEGTAEEKGEVNPLETCEFILSQPLGFFMFAQYLKDERNDYVRINFIEEVIRYRALLSDENRVERARYIAGTYLTKGGGRYEDSSVGQSAQSQSVDDSERKGRRSKRHSSRRRQSSVSIDDVDGFELPPRKDLDEENLCRPPQMKKKTDAEQKATDEKFQSLVRENLDVANKACFVGVDGPALTKCLQRVFRENNATEQALSEAMIAMQTEIQKEEERIGVERPKGKDKSSDSKENDDDKSKASEKTEGGSDVQAEDQYGITRGVFDIVELVVMEGIRRQYWDEFMSSPTYARLLNFWWVRDHKIVEQDFVHLRVLGRGGFGLVHACKRASSGRLFAMKVMDKRRIKIKKAEAQALSERRVLAAVDSPFIVKVAYSFQSQDNLFLLLDLMTGGDLGYHLQEKGKFSKPECLYFTARIMLGLQALHNQGYVYRDVKPHNILVGEDGRIKLSDLGLATVVTPRLHGAAGTRGYWAPEMLRRDARGKRMPYGISVDWWSFGCVLAEFISGVGPFRSEAALRFGLENGLKTKEHALDCATMKFEPEFDSQHYTEDAADICRRLLNKNEKRRLGVNGCEEIMAHPWYKEVDWDEVVSDRMVPPFKPLKDVNARGQKEIGTFVEDRTYTETELGKKEESIYKYWDWTNLKAFDAEVIDFLKHEKGMDAFGTSRRKTNGCCCSVQ